MGPTVVSTFATVDKRVKTLKSSLKELNAVSTKAFALDKASRQLQSLKAQYAANPTAQLKRQLDSATEAFTRAKAQANRYNITVADTARVQARAAAAISRTEAALARQQRRQANQNRRSELRGELFSTVAMAAAVGAPIKLAVEFEDSMAKVGALARANEEDLVKLTVQARQLGRDTVFTASQAAEGMSFLAMAGFDTNETMDAMPGLLDLAAAGATDLGRTADIASNILSAFKVKASDMGHVSDILTNAFTSPNTTLETLGETMKYVGPVASAVNMSLEDTAAAVGMLGNVGIQGSQAGTALRAALLRLSAPPKQAAEALMELTGEGVEGFEELMSEVGDAQYTLKSLGVTTKDAQGNLRPLADILEELNIKMEGMGSGERMEKIKKIFGTTASAAMTDLMVQAGQTVDKYGNVILDAYGNQTTALRQYMEKMNNSGGTASQIAKKMMDTTGGSLLVLRSAVQDLSIAFGNLLTPSIRTTAEGMTVVTNKASWVVQTFPRASTAVAGVVAGLIGLKIAAVAGGFAITILSDGLLIARGAVAAVRTATLALNAAMFANPVGLVVLAVGALAAGLYWLYQNCEPVRVAIDGLWIKIKAFGKSVLPVLLFPIVLVWKIHQKIWTAIGGLVRWVWNDIIGGASGLVNKLGVVFGPVITVFGTVWGAVAEGATTFFDFLGEKFDWVASKIAVVADAWATVKGLFNDEDDNPDQPEQSASGAVPVSGPAAALAPDMANVSPAMQTALWAVNTVSTPQQKLDDLTGKQLDHEFRGHGFLDDMDFSGQGALEDFDGFGSPSFDGLNIKMPEMGGGGINSQISIPITINGVPSSDIGKVLVDSIKSRESELEAYFGQMIERIAANQRRVAYDG
ncbi:phage tail tape measure protein [Deltaproteobacteria bacterium Smac51]|nr:phage tail tape measure protein [Deltaproteobacteria bacterium Smac51]